MRMDLFQHFSDSLQLLANGNQQLMIFPVRSFLNQSQFQLPVFHSLHVPNLLFAPAIVKPSS